MEKKENWFKQKKITVGFSIGALIGSFFFLNHSITGNVISNADKGLDLVSLIGLLLVICAVILGVYSIRKK